MKQQNLSNTISSWFDCFFVPHRFIHCLSLLLMFWISIADCCSPDKMSWEGSRLFKKKKFCLSKAQSAASGEWLAEVDLTPVASHCSSCLIMKVIKCLSWWGGEGGYLHETSTWLPKESLISGGVGHILNCFVLLSDTRQGQTDLASRSKGCCERVNSGSFHLIILAEFGPKRAAEAWSLDSRVHFISLLHALFLFSAHNSIPSLLCKTALSSGGGIWQQQIQSRSAQRPDRVLLLRPVIKASCRLLENTVVNLCLGAFKQDQNNVLLDVFEPYSRRQQNFIEASFLFLFSLAGCRGTEISPRMLHLSKLQDVHRWWRHLRSGGKIQTLLVSLAGPIRL